MKKRCGIISVLIVIATVICSCGSSGEEGRSATVIEVVNIVDAQPRPKDEWQPAEVEMSISGGGKVRTGDASTARLELLEGEVRLSPVTLFTVKGSTTRQGKLETALSLQEGRLWVDLTTGQPHEFSVETGNAVAAVRDTLFSVALGPEETTLVSVAEGKVVLTAEEKSVTVEAGEQATVEPGQPPSLPEPMSNEERGLWATEGQTPQLAPPTPTVEPTPSARAFEPDTDRPGLDIGGGFILDSDPKLCQDACSQTDECKAWTYVKPGFQGPEARCWLKFDVPAAVPHECCVSGVKLDD